MANEYILYHQMTLYIHTCPVAMFVLDDVMLLPHNVMAKLLCH